MARPTRWGSIALLDATRPPLPWPERLLIVGPDGLGDTLVALPMLRRLQGKSPRTRVTWMARAALHPVVQMMGVDAIADRDDRRELDVRAFDAIVATADIDAAFFGGMARLSEVPVRIGPHGARARPPVWNHLVRAAWLGRPRHEAQRFLRRLLPFGHGGPADAAELCRGIRLDPPLVPLPDDLPAGAVVLHPFSMGNGREWPLGHWIDVASGLAAQGLPVVFTGSAAEGERLAAAWPRPQRPEAVADAAGRLGLAQLATLLQGARAVAASGTGPLHLAAALGTPTLGLFPPRKGVATDRWAAIGPAAVSVQSRAACRRTRCQNDDCRCMAALAPERVARALQPQTQRTLDLAPLAPYLRAAPCASA